MEMHQIRYFLAVAQTLNFTRAAEECNVAQPSLTRAIKNLELELGGDLFRRERNSSHLTNLGRAMLPLLTNAYSSAIAAKSQAESFRKGDHAALRVALSQTVDIGLIIGAVGELARAFSNIQLSCLRVGADEVLDRLRSGDSEIAVAGPIKDSWDRLDSWPLFTEPHDLIVQHDHALANRDAVALSDLHGERLIVRPYCEQWPAWLAQFEANGIDPRHCHEVSNDRDAISLLEAGLGVGLLPRSARVESHLHRIALTQPVERPIQIYSVSGRQRSMALSSLLNLLRSADWTDRVALSD
jgi:DNA-binding transcriptional LysR family regulator